MKSEHRFQPTACGCWWFVKRAAVVLVFGIAAKEGYAARVWVAGPDAQALSPWMIRATSVNLHDDVALGDFLVPIIVIENPDDTMTSSATFTVDVPRAGNYRLWARMRCPSGNAESFDVVAEANGEQRSLGIWMNQPAGARDWQWRVLCDDYSGPAAPPSAATAKLSAGRWQFSARARCANATTYAPLKWQQAEPTFNPRLNAISLTDEADYTPSDRDAERALRLHPSPAAQPRVETAALPVLTEDAIVPGRHRLPDWMRVPRWFTKDSWRDELAGRHAGDIRQLVRQVAANGGNTLRLSCFWGGEAFFQSDVAPHAPGLGHLDYLREAVEEGDRLGVRIVAYINPNAIYADNPLFEDCAVRDSGGGIAARRAYRGDRGDTRYTCVNSPRYRKFLLDALTEIFAKYKPDGLYVDGLTPQPCFCAHCRRKYRELFGEPMPVEKLAKIKADWAVWAEFGSDPQPVGDVENDPDARRWTEMMYRTFGDVTRAFSETVKAAKPDALTMFHSHPKPNCAEFYDGTLTEVYSPQPWVHTAWRAGEMAGYSSVFPVPVLFNIYPHRHFTEHEARWLAFQGLANGAYPNFWSTPGMKPIFDFMAREAGALDFETVSAVKFMALPRDLRASKTQLSAPSAAGVRYKQDRFLAPYVGAYSALMRSSVPVVTLHRPHFEDSLKGFRVLCLANVALMSDAQVAAVRQFVQNGGGLLATHETSLYDEKGRRRDDFALADLFGVHYRGLLPAKARTVEFANQAVSDSFRRDRNDLEDAEPHVAVSIGSATVAAWLKADDVPAESAPAVLTQPVGKGRVVYLPGRLDAAQCETLSPGTERLFANAVRWLAHDELPVRVEASGIVGVSLYQQPQRYLVHLLNQQRDSLDRSEDHRRLSDLVIHVQLPLGVRATNVSARWTDKTVPYEQSGQMVSVRLPVLDEYELLAVEWH